MTVRVVLTVALLVLASAAAFTLDRIQERGDVNCEAIRHNAARVTRLIHSFDAGLRAAIDARQPPSNANERRAIAAFQAQRHRVNTIPPATC